jgi:hypothetical protein
MKEYLTQMDALYSMAKREDFSPARTANTKFKV